MPNRRELIIKTIGEEGEKFIEKYVDLSQTKVLATQSLFNIESIEGEINNFVNLKRINDFLKINEYFRVVSSKMPMGGRFISFVETYYVRKQRLLKKFPYPFNWIYYILDFILTRILPKIWLTSRLYFFLSGGKRRVLSKTETLGRLVYCGYSIIETAEIDNKLFFVVEKIKEPLRDGYTPRYGFLIKLPRVGKNGKIIKVYKLRTMHAYSEYIQQYVYEKNELAEGGKIKDDFRIPGYGTKLRKYWIDELPMIINLLKGEMKIVGVRPLSKHYMSLYDKELQELRIKAKPGLLPPFYVDMPKDLPEIIASEKKYLKAYLESPIKTDCIYLLKIMQNILLRGKRSA